MKARQWGLGYPVPAWLRSVRLTLLKAISEEHIVFEWAEYTLMANGVPHSLENINNEEDMLCEHVWTMRESSVTKYRNKLSASY